MKARIGEVGRHYNEIQQTEVVQVLHALAEQLGFELHRVATDQFGGTEIVLQEKPQPKDVENDL